MRQFKKRKAYKKNTIIKILLIVFFCVFINALILFNIYGKKVTGRAVKLIDSQLNTIIYNFFNELITPNVLNLENQNDLLIINKNAEGEILSVNYNMKKTYSILANITNILKKGIMNLEKGQINITTNNKYLAAGEKGLILKIPLFLTNDNLFLNNWGPQIPVIINFNETILTNIKTKVTNYGFNNALLEIYVTVEMQKLIITPLNKEDKKFHYDILIGALVINGEVPEFYGEKYETSSSILDIPKDLSL